MTTDSGTVKKARDFIIQYGGFEGDHHRAWTIDQVFRILTGNNYEREVTEAKSGEDGPETYSWDVGVAP